MPHQPIDDTELMAYADGEVDPQAAARIQRALAGDPALAQRLALFTGSRSAVKDAFQARLEPAPEALVARLRGVAEGKVAVLTPRARPAWRPAAVAAGLALAVGLGAGWLVFGAAPGTGPVHLAVLDRADVAAAFSDLASGESRALDGAGRLTAIASFRDRTGTLCREVEHDPPAGATLVAVACRHDEGWSVRLAVAAGSAEGFAPASSLETLDAWLTATGAGAPLEPAEEARALAGLAAAE